ncbi:Glutathione S-transferase U17 [Gossypium arboreum]|uniref:glutathione transferase n=2 Tax=Gossypium arboreum TaxID=29729 RepID=A0A0B0NKT6_GOSAR|nr:Glutathione S-transferase U17 [Gossypium arboreum]
MAESNVMLLGTWASPFVLRVKIALRLKSVNYEYHEENLPESKSDLLLKSNPVYKKVPVLIHGHNPICESLIIVEYIDEVWTTSASSILPSDAYERAQSRFWAAYVEDKFSTALRRVLFGTTEEDKRAAMAEVSEGILLLEEAFVKLSKGKAFFGGENIGFVDIVFGSLLAWIEVIEKLSEMKLISEAKTPSEAGTSQHNIYIKTAQICGCERKGDMADSNVKVLGTWASPFVMRVKIALHLKSVRYEDVEEDLLAPKSELLLKSNPIYKKIPVFFHAHNPICESLIILQYIDEVWTTSAPSILPSDPYERSQSRFWAAYVDDKFFPALGRLLIGATEEDKKAALAEVVEGTVVLEGAFGKLSKGKAFFGGDNIGFVDIALGSLLGWIEVIGKQCETKLVSEAKTPRLVQWAECFSANEAVKDVLPDVDKLADFGLKLRAKVLKALAPTN